MKTTKSFSLVELLVVIAIIALLAALLLPALQKAKKMALTAACSSNQRQCGLALVSYAEDFADWIIGGECTNASPYNLLSELMIATNFAPRTGIYHPTWGMGMSYVPNNQVYACPALSPPAAYKMWNTQFPGNGYPGTSAMCYGLRIVTSTLWYPGEKTADSTQKGLMKYSSLYQPSRLPYMVDTMNYTNPVSGSASPGMSQWYTWYMDGGTWGAFGNAGALHLRHSRRANVWFPDGHVGSWAANDTTEFKMPNNGNPTWTIGYVY